MQTPRTTNQSQPVCPGAPRRSKKRSAPKYSSDSNAKRRLFVGSEYEIRRSARNQKKVE